jgi:hypothetical protein
MARSSYRRIPILVGAAIGVIGALALGVYQVSQRQERYGQPKIDCSSYQPIPIVLEVERGEIKNNKAIFSNTIKKRGDIGQYEALFVRESLSVEKINGVDRVVAHLRDPKRLEWKLVYPKKEGRHVAFATFAQKNHPCYSDQNSLN